MGAWLCQVLGTPLWTQLLQLRYLLENASGGDYERSLNMHQVSLGSQVAKIS